MGLLFSKCKKICAAPLILKKKKKATSSLDSPEGPIVEKKSLKFGRTSALVTLEIHLSLTGLRKISLL